MSVIRTYRCPLHDHLFESDDPGNCPLCKAAAEAYVLNPDTAVAAAVTKAANAKTAAELKHLNAVRDAQAKKLASDAAEVAATDAAKEVVVSTQAWADATKAAAAEAEAATHTK